MHCQQWFLKAALAFLIAAGSLYGQAASSLVGTVHDSSGAVIPGVTVTATHTETGISYERTTNQIGDYIFPDLPLGTYNLNFKMASFQEVKVEKIEMHVASTIRQDAVLSPASVATQVKVIASTPLVKTETSETGQLVGSRQISELPLNGRNVYSLLQLTAGTESGVSPSAMFANNQLRPTIAGGRGGYTTFRVNGEDVNNQSLPQAGITPSVDAVEEFRATTQLAPGLGKFNFHRQCRHQIRDE